MQVDLQELKAEGQSKALEVADCRSQLEDVLTTIAAREKEIIDLEPQYNDCTSLLNSLEYERKTTSQRLETLYGKQGRGQQFNSVNDRNSFLRKQIEALQTQLHTKQALLERLTAEVAGEEVSLAEESEKQKVTEIASQDLSGKLESFAKQAKELLVKRNRAQEVRKTVWKELENIQESTQEVKADLEKGQQSLNSSLPRHISQGLACVERIAIEKGLVESGAYKGPLIDNFSLTNDAFRLAGNAS